MRLHILGDGGHSLEIEDLAKFLGYSDVSRLSIHDEELTLSRMTRTGNRIVIGVGNPSARLQINKKIKKLGLEFTNLVHPNSNISKSASIGDGSVIQFGVSITSNVRIGEGVLVNLNSTIGHGAILGSGVVVNPNASISGECSIGDGVLIGSGAIILAGIQIGDNAKVGAGAVVTRDIPKSMTVVGIPAKEMKD